MKANIRKIIVQVDEIHFDGGKTVNPPTRRALAMAVIANPYAGRFSESLDELIDIGEELGGMLGERCVQALGIAPEQAQSYGKAAIVGEAGELEHAAAILHPKLGAPLRIAVEKGLFGLAWIGLLHPDTGRLQIAAHIGATQETLEILEAIISGTQSGSGCAMTARALKSGQHSVCNDIEHDPEAACWRADGTPIGTGGGLAREGVRFLPETRKA